MKLLTAIIYIFIQENALKNIVYEIAAILPRPQCLYGFLGQINVIIGILKLLRKRGIAMLRVDKFPYPRQQTRGN